MPMIELKDICLSFPHKTCFAGFSSSIEWGQRIAIVGDNGNGKSSLLRMLHGSLEPSQGSIRFASDLEIGYVAQIIEGKDLLSGGQRVNQALSQALAQASDLLLLDEPTNHLDAGNRRSLSRMLENYYGTVVMVTHDHDLLNRMADIIWHIGHGRIEVFSGCYANYLAEQESQRNSLERQLSSIKRAKRDVHEALMQEQKRAANARQRGIKSIQERKWATVRSPTKLGHGTTTAGRNQAALLDEQHELSEQLSQLRPPEIIVPHFQLQADIATAQTVLQISEGAVGYDAPLIENIHLSLERGERMALLGRNGSGKTTLARAIMGEEELRLGGDWITPPRQKIGQIDQHYGNLPARHTVLQALADIVPAWTIQQLRTHLSYYLFRKSESVQTMVSMLSGGEKARLSLACIAAAPPQLLILDEPTNNLDITTRTHLVQVLKAYPGAMLLISHDPRFFEEIGVSKNYSI